MFSETMLTERAHFVGVLLVIIVVTIFEYIVIVQFCSLA